MPKFAQVRPRELVSAFEKLGFYVDHQTGSHAVLYRDSDQKRAVIPLHTRVIPRGTFTAILREAGVRREDIVL
ncbi:MAG: type II toxin-antitoxin system HicA family toxin [Patescibacteria group bacterium]